MKENTQISGIEDKFDAAYDLYASGDYDAAYKAYLELAEMGYRNCQVFLGSLFYSGTGVGKDSEKARYWLEKAADDDVIAQFLLGKLAADEQDYISAFEWYEKANERGYAPASYKMAIYIEKGRVTESNKLLALELYRKAAEQKHIYAERTLAFRLLKGWGGFFGIFEGVKWFFKMLKDGYKVGKEEDWSNDSLRV